MRLCRIREADPLVAFYGDEFVVPVAQAAELFGQATQTALDVGVSSDLLDYLPPNGQWYAAAVELHDWVFNAGAEVTAPLRIDCADADILVPIPRPNKLFLLAGNYAAHIEEGGGIAAERRDTIPYVFMKPPSTTLTHPGRAVTIPAVSPNQIDWELELCIVIGTRCKGVAEADALNHVAGYTIVNDISDRHFRPNEQRKQRDRDSFFDWLHGKWHDSFCPCGPCVATPETVPDPQSLKMQLAVNGRVFQDASTALQIFPVAAVIEFISSFVTLEPGDLISTGTPSGVGKTSGTFLAAGDQVAATIERIGTLHSKVTN